jgi:pimeloyl-ACP methyl ester carboxylesterase
MKDVVVLLPGILGSALEKDGATLWDVSASAIGRALLTLGGSVQALALQGDGRSGEGVTASRLLDDVHLMPFLWKIDGYSGLAHFIQAKLTLTPGEDFFEFPYDWRLDNRVNARRLAEQAAVWLERRRRHEPQARLVLIGHSMGGLVARYFIEVLGGWRDTRTLVTLGTPHRGSVKALDFLANGLRQRLGPVTLLDLSQLVRSFPSVHQLLPIYPCVGESADDLVSLEKVDRSAIGELNLARARAGIEFHREIERAVQANRLDPAYGYRLLPFVGAYQPTYLSALLTDGGVEPLLTYKGESMLDGDGTVPRLSATPIELSDAHADSFVACPHASLQNFDPVRVQLRATLQDVDIKRLRAAGTGVISMNLPDTTRVGFPVEVRARCVGAGQPLQAWLMHVETATASEKEFAMPSLAGDWQTLEMTSLVPGTYRLRTSAGDTAEAIEDVFLVLP